MFFVKLYIWVKNEKIIIIIIMLKLKLKKETLNYKFLIIAKKKTPYTGKVIKNLGNFNSKIIKLDIILLIFWIKNIKFSKKAHHFISRNIMFSNKVQLKYKFQNYEKI